jgi:hypothetical protein
METTCLAELELHFQRNTWRYIPNERTQTETGCGIEALIQLPNGPK